MLTLVETFDNIASPDQLANLGWSIVGLGNTGDTYNFIVAPGFGRLGTSALGLSIDGAISCTLPPLAKSSTRMIVGLAINHGLGGYSTLKFTFKRGSYVNFTVTLKFDAYAMSWNWPPTEEQDFGNILVTACTATSGTGYPNITIPSVILPSTGSHCEYTFLEVLVDCADISNGIFKVAVNGVEYINKTGIKTTDSTGFGNDPYSVNAKYDTVTLDVTQGQRYYTMPHPGRAYIDTIYVCDGEGGYQTDFLGPIFSKSYYPVSQGSKSNWTAIENSATTDTLHNYIVDEVSVINVESKYLEAYQDLVDELFSFGDSTVPPGYDIVSINYRTEFRNVASPGNPTPNSLVPLFKLAGNDTLKVETKAKKLTGWTYGYLDSYYPIVPDLAIPWTPYLLEQSQFGFMLKESIWTSITLEPLDFEDSCTVE